MIKDTKDVLAMFDSILHHQEINSKESWIVSFGHSAEEILEAFVGSWNIPEELEHLSDREKGILLTKSFELIKRAAILYVNG